MASPLPVSDDGHPDNRARGIGWRLGGAAVLAWALFGLFSLATYTWKDIPLEMSPPNTPVTNWLGTAGAWYAYALFVLLGAAAWLLVVWPAWAGGRMVCGWSLRWRPVGMVLATLPACGLLQGLRSPLAQWAGPNGVNLGGDAGGRCGELLLDRALEPWLGALGATSVLLLVLALASVVVVGPRSLAVGLREVQAFRARRDLRRTEEEASREEERSQMGRDRDRLSVVREKQDARTQKEEAKRQREEAAENARRGRDAERDAQRAAKEAARAEAVRAREAAARQAQERRDELFNAQRRTIEEEAARKKIRPVPATTAPAPVVARPADDPPTNYRLPAVELLQAPPPFTPDVDDTDETSRTIVEVLQQFGIPVKITAVIRGPVITRYELLPAPGIRVNKVTSYSDNLQMALRAVSIRILTPIPGQGVMGIEVPNARPRMVTIREVAEGETWRRESRRMALPLLLGKDVAGDDLVVDLARMPHLLIAGATGSGKSACINSLLAGLLMARKPEELRLLLVDPKMVEFTPYAELPHLVVPIITEPKKVGVSLQWAISEMSRRLKIFSRVGVRNIADFNVRDRAVQATFLAGEELAPEPIPARLPYIVIVIDEIHDLMLVAQAEIENRIARLAAKSRAAGIHMVLATQRPSVNVITGTIKANFPGRIAFQVAQKVDSRTILDVGGADALIGRGDMLFLTPQGASLIRAQGAWVTDAEVHSLVACLKAQGKPVYEVAIKERLDKVSVAEADDDFDGDGGDGGDGKDGGSDDVSADEKLIKAALEVIRQTRRATTSSLQRHLKIGYNKAAGLMDQLQQRGYIGPTNGNDPREILVDLDGQMPDSGADQ